MAASRTKPRPSARGDGRRVSLNQLLERQGLSERRIRPQRSGAQIGGKLEIGDAWHIQSRATRRIPQGVPLGTKGPASPMISVAALRMQQFGVQFYQASLTAKDIDKLVRFEVLSYGEQGTAPGCAALRVNRRSAGICSNAGSRPTKRRINARSSAGRSTSSFSYYEQCRQARDLPSIRRRRHHLVRRAAEVRAVAGEPSLGILKVPEREGILRAIDGQHRLLALHAGIEHFGDENFTVPGGHLRSAPRRSRRPDVRHDQREAHAAERLTSRVALGPPAVSR